MENVVNLFKPARAPISGTTARPTEAPKAPSAISLEVTTTAFLNTLLRTVRDRDERKITGLVRKIGYAAYPSLAQAMDQHTFGLSAEVFEKELEQVIYALRNPDLAKRSKLGNRALKLGLSIDFAVRAAFGGKGV